MRQFFKQFFKNQVGAQSELSEAELIHKHDLANETQKEVYRAFLSQRNITIPDYLKLDATLRESDN